MVDERKTARFISQPAMRKNMMINQHCMTAVYGLAGATAGIIGLNGWRFVFLGNLEINFRRSNFLGF